MSEQERARITSQGNNHVSLMCGDVCLASICPVDDEIIAKILRLAACWNACEGIETNVLEYTEGAFKTSLEKLDKQNTQKAKLREALENLQVIAAATVERHAAKGVFMLGLDEAARKAHKALTESEASNE